MGIMNAYYTGLVVQIGFAAIVVYFFYFYAKKRDLPIPKWSPFAAGAILMAYILYVAITGFGQYHVSSFSRLSWSADEMKITYANGGEKTETLGYEEEAALKIFDFPLVKAQYDEKAFDGFTLTPYATLTFFEKDKAMMTGELFTIDETDITRHSGSDNLIPISVNDGERVLTTLNHDALYVIKLHNQIIAPDPIWLESILTGVVPDAPPVMTVSPGLYVAEAADDYPGGSLELTENGKFVFNRSLASSYDPQGNYTLEGNTLVCQTIQKETYRFTVDGDTLYYIEEQDGILTPDGTAFILKK